jgi:hypothetical protein
MMQGTRWRAQDGFIREILWFVLIIVIIAVVVLDGIAIFTAHQSIKEDASRAARAAATEYVQSQSTSAAKLAAQEGLLRDNEKLTKFTVSTAPDGSAVFTVTARAHADTRAFKFLRYVGLSKWVDDVTNPSATRSSQ